MSILFCTFASRKDEFFDMMRHCKAVGRQARIKFNLTPKSRKGQQNYVRQRFRNLRKTSHAGNEQSN